MLSYINMRQLVLTSLQQRFQEVLQAIGETAHHVARVSVFRQEERQLEVRVLLQLNLSAVAPCQLVRCVFCHRHDVVYQFLCARRTGVRNTVMDSEGKYISFGQR